MKIIDAYILARTKRKTRRIRTALVVLVSALLFAVLFFGAFVATGLKQSAAQFKDVGYNGRYLTVVYKNGAPGAEDPAAVEAGIRKEMDAELKSRGVKVDDSVRQNSEYMLEQQLRMGKYFAEQATKDQASMEQQITAEFHPKSIYHIGTIDAMYDARLKTDANSDPYLQELREGKGSSAYAPMEFSSTMFSHVESDMLAPLLQQGSTLDWQPGQPYPALLPYSYIAKIADRSFAGLSSQEKVDGYAQLIRDYTGKELTYCARNGAAQQQLSAVLAYNKQAESDKDSKTKPIAVAACERFDQAQLKKLGITETPSPDAPKPLFPKTTTTPPVTKNVAVKIVGFVPTRDYSPNESILRSTFSEVNGWPGADPIFIPSEVVAADAFLKTKADGGFVSPTQIMADFATRKEQKTFLDSGCTGSDCLNANPSTFIIFPFGSIKVALEGTFRGVTEAMKWVVLAVSIIASLLILLTISKIIADSRREIAVFRALGARRRDIAQIYFTYGFMLAGSSLVVSIMLAAIGALIFSAQFSTEVNAVMVEAVGAFTMVTNTSLFGVNWLWMLGITAVLFLASSVGILIPVLLSNRKNLMSIMRDE